MRIALYSHGGSANHGCEALVRSIVDVLGPEYEYVLVSEKYEEDYRYGLQEKVSIVDSRTDLPSGMANLIYRVRRKLSNSDKVFYQYRYRDFAKRVGSVDFALSIGGDNYCYDGFLEQFSVQNDILVGRNIPIVLCGCSIDPDRLTEDVLADLRKYQLITVRESLTYQALKSKGIENVELIPDTAFALKTTDVSLSDNFLEGETVGINISPLILKHELKKGIVLENYCKLIDFILSETNMNVALIPHVVWDGNDDRQPLSLLYKKYEQSGRVVYIKDCGAQKLKGYISKCRFMIAARTHASIAAYSSGIPTLVMGYSIKSRGIAKDLFDDEQHYVMPVNKLQFPEEMLTEFKWLMSQEKAIKQRLGSVMPQYRRRIEEFPRLLKTVIN